jgi:predicted RNase H-like HicB family nuclease
LAIRGDSPFIVEVPELPGCMADGPTYQEAVAKAEIIIHEWINTAREEGRSIPIPKGKLKYA